MFVFVRVSSTAQEDATFNLKPNSWNRFMRPQGTNIGAVMVRSWSSWLKKLELCFWVWGFLLALRKE